MFYLSQIVVETCNTLDTSFFSDDSVFWLSNRQVFWVVLSLLVSRCSQHEYVTVLSFTCTRIVVFPERVWCPVLPLAQTDGASLTLQRRGTRLLVP